MPRIYRVMKQSAVDAKPEIGDTATKLGVRESDLAPGAGGEAVPGKGGMSVVSSIAGLRRRMQSCRFPPDMVPKRLHDAGAILGAIGSNSLHLYRHGVGPFAAGSVSSRLSFAPDVNDHGTVQPAVSMPYNGYRVAIVQTRDSWTSGEADPHE